MIILDILRTILIVCVLFCVFMVLSLDGVLNFSEQCHLEKIENVGSISYNYLDKDGKLCGTIIDTSDNPYSYVLGDFAYAYPTQWWNYSNLRGKHYSTFSVAQTAVEKLCKLR